MKYSQDQCFETFFSHKFELSYFFFLKKQRIYCSRRNTTKELITIMEKQHKNKFSVELGHCRGADISRRFGDYGSLGYE